tara:strand:- start:321 stop:1343 length:1023 start_codon:yes stop_codon:yes gene_type:complete
VYIGILLLLLTSNIYASIGSITEFKGNASIIRESDKIDAKKDSSINSMDTIETGKGIVGISFDDDTQVKITENSKLLIDDFVYDPNNKSIGKLTLKCLIGTVRYASGNIAHNNHKNVSINTPTATIAVRGTAFTMTVDEIGQSMIILLPNIDGSVGEIIVSTPFGTVLLNQAFQATVTTSTEIRPMTPVLLLINESAINNLMIVKPPKEITRKLLDENKVNGVLDFTGWDVDILTLNAFVDPYARFDELSIDYLMIDYLTNVLDTDTSTGKFAAGYNPTSQVYIFDKETYWMVRREVVHNTTLLLNKDRGYNIVLKQDGTTIKLQSSASTTNNINIIQGE